MKKQKPTRVVILGGGFGGVYAAMELERKLKKGDRVEVTLVNQDNFFLFTPMLHEVAASDLDVTTIVNPLRQLLRKSKLFIGNVNAIDLEAREVHVSHGVEDQHPHVLPFDHLIIALGSVTNLYGLPGLEGRVLTMKTLGDALAVRNRMIESLEEADFECCPKVRQRMLTIVVAGGGFAGVETVAAVNDFLHESLRFYRGLNRKALRVVLVHSQDTILPELDPRLGLYAAKKLRERGVELRLGVRVESFLAEGVRLSDQTVVDTRTLIWTAGTSPHPLVATLPCGRERGRILVRPDLSVPGVRGVWAVGDCALIPDGKGGFHPPTAQHASRQGKVVAKNLLATLRGQSSVPFRFRTLGQLASLGRRTGVASILGIRFSGFIAWWLWRTIYLLKLPRFERRVRVALDWTMDLFFAKDLVKSPTTSAPILQDLETAAAHR